MQVVHNVEVNMAVNKATPRMVVHCSDRFGHIELTI